MEKKRYDDPESSEKEKFGILMEQSTKTYYKIRFRGSKTVHKTETLEEAINWVEELIAENYAKPVENRSRLFIRSFSFGLSPNRPIYHIEKVEETLQFTEYIFK